MPKATKAAVPVAAPPKRKSAKAAKPAATKAKAAKRQSPSHSLRRNKLVKGTPAATSGPGSQGTHPGSPYTTLTPLVLELFLEGLARTANVTMVCNELRINRLTIYHLKNNDPEFLAKFNAAMSTGHDAWEDEVARRAFSGYKREVYQQGILVGHTTEFSDSLATFILRGAKPEQYRERTSQDVSVKGNVVAKLDALSDDELNEIINNKLATLGPIGSMAKAAVKG